jgi:raffinose/stachyose/melibiose transport system permease protein
MNKIGKYLFALVIAIFYLIPFYILITISFKSPQDMSSKWVFPHYLYLDNFSNAWNNAWLGKALINNLIISCCAVALVILIGSCASYPLARFQTRWNKFIYTLIIACMIVPGLTILVPLYQIILSINGINTYWAIIILLVTFQLPFTIFLYTGFINTVSRELDEAALIDGCSRMGVFFRIIFPLLRPVTATVIIFTGTQTWNDYQFSMFFLAKREVQTVTVSLANFISQYQSNMGWVAAGCLVGVLPLAIIYLFLQKYFIKGITSGAVKG